MTKIKRLWSKIH